MSGTRIGGLRAAQTNKAKHGEDFYAKTGSTGGKNSTTGGFYANRELARTAGAKGGRRSSRQGVKNDRPVPRLIEGPRPSLINRLKELLHG